MAVINNIDGLYIGDNIRYYQDCFRVYKRNMMITRYLGTSEKKFKRNYFLPIFENVINK